LPDEDERPVMQDKIASQIWTNCPATRPGKKGVPPQLNLIRLVPHSEPSGGNRRFGAHP